MRRLFAVFFLMSVSAAYAAVPEDAWTALNKRTVELVQAGKLEDAFENAQKAVAQARVQFGLQHLNTAKAMNNLANLYAVRGYPSAARDLYNKVLAIESEQLGAEDPVLVDTLFNLGNICLLSGNRAEAKPFLEKALRIQLKSSPDETAQVKKIRSLLAQIQNPA